MARRVRMRCGSATSARSRPIAVALLEMGVGLLLLGTAALAHPDISWPVVSQSCHPLVLSIAVLL
jgi:hypothetical protein